MNYRPPSPALATDDPPLSTKAHALGNVITVFREHHPINAPQGGVQLILSSLICLLILWALSQMARHIDYNFFLLVLVLGGGIAGIADAVNYIHSVVKRGKRYIFQLDGGLAIVTENGEAVYRWQDIADVFQKTTQHRFTKEIEYTLTFEDGRTFSLDHNYAHYKELGECIQMRFQNKLYERALADLKAGREVHFQRATLIQEALILDGKKILPYENIKQVDMKENGFYLQEQGKLMATTFIAWTQVPAAPVLARLLNYMIEERRYAASRK